MMDLLARISTAALLLGPLLSCAGVHQQRSLAVGGAERFRQLFNAGECAEIYAEAGTIFQASRTREQWLKVCRDLRGQLGTMISFIPANSASWLWGPPGVVWQAGPGKFTEGVRLIRFDWDVEGGQARLCALLIQAQDANPSGAKND